jgi:hypothetical protein
VKASSCPIGGEQFEEFEWSWRPGEPRVQYDYRREDGRLFSTVAPDLETARCRRDVWLAAQSPVNFELIRSAASPARAQE